jgi:SNF2 family DNA or RNA helicase
VERFPGAVHVLGEDSAASRDAAVTAFQRPDGPQVIVCSLRAAGQGLTLTRASNVAFLELDWTPARLAQAEDRCHRIGQASAVTAWYLVAPDTIDETMAELLEHKRAVIGAVTDGHVVESESLIDAVVRDLRDRPGAGAQAYAA